MATDIERCAEVIARLGLSQFGPVRAVAALSGGVSAEIFVVTAENGKLCVKFPRDKLNVAAEWIASPQRSRSEYEWLRFAATVSAHAVPMLYGFDEPSCGIAMEFLPPEHHQNWKRELLDGVVDVPFAAQLGTLLARLHARSAGEPDVIAERFPNEHFRPLRTDAYFLFTADRYPQAAPRLRALADGLIAARIALMHGDVSPKNILKGPHGPVLLDAETAAFGDPAFDVAFCLTHLVAKAICRPALSPLYLDAARALLGAYLAGVDWEPAAAIDGRIAALTPALMLARVGGKSPLEYLQPAQADHLQNLALALLADRPGTCADMLHEVEGSLHA